MTASVRATSHRVFVGFLVVSFVSQLGSASALLGSTVISSDAGKTGALAATYTALMLALNYAVSSAVTPYAPLIAERVGTKRLYVLLQFAGAVLYGVVGILVLSGAPGYPLLLICTPLWGAFGGISHAVAPLVIRAYSADEDLAVSESQMSTATGAAWMIGALVSGVAIDRIGAGSALAANLVLTIPLVVYLWFVPPPATPDDPTKVHRPWHLLVRELRGNPMLRRAALLGGASAILLGPLVSMIVPVARDLRHPLAIHAALLLACVAFGEMLAPVVVRRLRRRPSHLGAAAQALIVGGFIVVVIALLVELLDSGPELVAAGAFLIVFGAVNYGGSSLIVASAAQSDRSNRAEAMTVYFLTLGVATPLGTLAWGHLMDRYQASVVMILGGLLMVAVAAAMVVWALRIKPESAASSAAGSRIVESGGAGWSTKVADVREGLDEAKADVEADVERETSFVAHSVLRRLSP